MFEMTLYFVVTYFLVFVFFSAVMVRDFRALADRNAQARQGQRGGLFGRYAIARTVVILALPLIPYAVVALQTLVMLPSLSRPLEDAIRRDWGRPAKPRIVRVLRVWPSTTVYAVLPCHNSTGESGEVGMLHTFHRVGGEWKWDGAPDAAWSDCGSADGNTFPPYPEAHEF